MKQNGEVSNITYYQAYIIDFSAILTGFITTLFFYFIFLLIIIFFYNDKELFLDSSLSINNLSFNFVTIFLFSISIFLGSFLTSLLCNSFFNKTRLINSLLIVPMLTIFILILSFIFNQSSYLFLFSQEKNLIHNFQEISKIKKEQKNKIKEVKDNVFEVIKPHIINDLTNINLKTDDMDYFATSIEYLVKEPDLISRNESFRDEIIKNLSLMLNKKNNKIDIKALINKWKTQQNQMIDEIMSYEYNKNFYIEIKLKESILFTLFQFVIFMLASFFGGYLAIRSQFNLRT